MQPLAADDVAAALAEVAVGSPANGMLEVAGPESMTIAEFVGKALAASGDYATCGRRPAGPLLRRGAGQTRPEARGRQPAHRSDAL